MKSSKTTTHNQVIDYLQWTTDEYEQRIFQAMYNWCQIHGKWPSIIQQYLANAAINKWFLAEYSKCEQDFIKIAEHLPNNPRQLEAHYKACTADIGAKYCKPLMKNIKRNKDFSNLFLDNAPVYYSN